MTACMTRCLVVVFCMLVACGPRPRFAESSSCGSRLAAVAGPRPALSIAAPSAFAGSCLVRDGAADCTYEFTLPPGAVVHAEQDEAGTCAIYADGRLYCDVQSDPYSGETPFDDAGPWALVRVANRGACAIRQTGALWCRGRDGYPTEGRFVDVALGLGHACALLSDGGVRCWGDGSEYCENDAPAGPYIGLTAAGRTTCGLRADGVVDCWGRTLAARPSHESRAVQIVLAGDGEVVCARYEDGALACDDSTWLLPHGTFTSIAAGPWLSRGACALRSDQQMFCFGPSIDGPHAATIVVTPTSPSPRLGAFTNVERGGIEVSLPCEPTMTQPVVGVTRYACEERAPAALIALEVVHPGDAIVRAGPQAMLQFALNAKLLAFEASSLESSGPLLLNERQGIRYSILVAPNVRLQGRAYVDGDVIYAVTGMWELSAIPDVWSSIASMRFRAALAPAPVAPPGRRESDTGAPEPASPR